MSTSAPCFLSLPTKQSLLKSSAKTLAGRLAHTSLAISMKCVFRYLVSHALVNFEQLRLHTDGFLSTELTSSPPLFDLAALRKGCKVVESEEFYAPINHFAQYGPMFRRVTRFWRGANEGLAEVRGFAPDLTEQYEFATFCDKLLSDIFKVATIILCILPFWMLASMPWFFLHPPTMIQTRIIFRSQSNTWLYISRSCSHRGRQLPILSMLTSK